MDPATPKYVPPHRRSSTSPSSTKHAPRSHSPSYRHGQPYLTLADLHARYSPPNSPSLRMPRVQRSLSAEDLFQRFRHRPPESQAKMPPSAFHPWQPTRQPLSPKLPDPPVFNGNRSKFEDWKLKVLDKLRLNQDHFPTEEHRLYYVLSRLGDEAVESTLVRRRQGAVNPFRTVTDLLDYISDLYETPPCTITDSDTHCY